MTLENFADIASIASAIFGLIGLLGSGVLVYKFVFKQQNNTAFTVHGDINGDVITGGVSGKTKPEVSK